MSRESIRERALQLWSRLSTTQKIAGGVAILTALLLAVVGVSSSQGTTYAIAYSGLTEADAAEIVAMLQEQGIPYEVSAGESVIRVPSDKVHDVRLSAAAAGLPSGGTVGYELFDGTNLGMTDFTQQINYRRSLEGELARTIASLDAVEQARVHIVIPEDTIYSQEQKEPTASVLLKLKSGRGLTDQQVLGITHLIATSVEGLAAENITVLDTKGEVLNDGLAEGSDAVNSTHFAIQHQYESTIEDKVAAMLDTVLGPNRAVVTAHADLDWTEIETSSEAYEPAPSGTPAVRTAREEYEAYAGTPTAAEGVPGTDSNLPSYTGVSGDQASAGQGEAGLAEGQAYERTGSEYTYEISRVVSHTLQSPGAVKRLSVSVLVDEVTDEAQLESIRQAVAAAAGIDSARGDTVLVDTVAFDRSFYEEQEAELAKSEKTSQYMTVARYGAIAVAAIVAILLIRGMVMRAITPPKPIIATAAVPTSVLAIDSESGGEGAAPQAMQLPNGETIMLTPEQQAVADSVQRQHQLIAMAQKQPELVAQVVQLWLSENRQPGRS